MGFYPVFVELTGRRCLVVGGGAVAERRVAALLAAGATVTVVAPDLTQGLGDLAAAGRIAYEARKYGTGDIADYELAFVAADGPGVSDEVLMEGRRAGVWVNAADDPEHCDFILPAIVRRGDLTVAIATGGRSPALTRAIREELEAYFTDDYAALADLVAEVRSELRRGRRSPDGETWRRALRGDVRRLLSEGRRDEAKRRLLEGLGAA
jgi:precorrin-2 dehydrogenase/sirohydrochlorin ferrochelatase